jgi:hypothetical protein
VAVLGISEPLPWRICMRTDGDSFGGLEPYHWRFLDIDVGGFGGFEF